MKVLGVIIGAIIAIGLVLAFNGWVIMLLWGAIAGALGWQTLGFGTSVAAGALLAVIGSFFKGNK
jgi:hypothetical protein